MMFTIVFAQDDDEDYYDDTVDTDEYYEDEVQDEQTLGGFKGTNEDLLASTVFIADDFDPSSLTAGQVIKTIVGVSNNGNTPYNITSYGGSIRSAYDYDYIIQNLTSNSVGLVLPGENDITFGYYFMIADLEPVDFNLEIWVKFNDSLGNEYLNNAYNNTFTLIGQKTEFDTKTFITFLLTLIALYLTKTLFTTGKIQVPVSGSDNTTERSGSGSSNDAAEWDVPVYTTAKVSRKAKKKKNKKAKKN